MEKGYVYIARIVDHGGKFVNGYHKIGKSIQYKIRETQLNSTHLPFDVLFVKVFETDNMSQLESILHTCFEDYRVEKEYDYRRNITTEWFDVSDIDVLNSRVNKIVRLMGATEVDMIQRLSEDKTISNTDKSEMTSAIRRNSPSKVVFKVNGEDLTQSTAKDTFVLAMTKIGEIVGWDVLDVREPHIATSVDELGFDYEENKMTNCAVYVGNYVVWTNTSNQEKVRRVNNHIKYFGLDGFEFYVEK
jgi:hypothetical protein